jgi:hypothetical protein
MSFTQTPTLKNEFVILNLGQRLFERPARLRWEDHIRQRVRRRHGFHNAARTAARKKRNQRICHNNILARVQPMRMYTLLMTIDLNLFGPLAALAGMWEGADGDDTAPDDFRGVEKNLFREQLVFTPMLPAANHEQILYVLGYTRTAWRLREDDPFHQQLGYWMWDPAARQVMHSFIIPRGVTVLAGGPADPDSKNLRVSAEAGSSTFGICSNPFLDREFKTVRYDATLTLHSTGSFSYEENTQMVIKGQDKIFHHIDKNRLKKV